MKLIIFYICLMIFLVNCDYCKKSHKKPKLDEKWLNVNLLLKYEKDPKEYFTYFHYTPGPKSYYEETFYRSGLTKKMYTNKYQFSYFDTSDGHIEIFFRKPVFFRPEFTSFHFFNTLICMDTNKKKTAYFIWFNDYKKNFKEETDIGTTTDSVFTNLGFSDFIKLYPDFKGKFYFNLVKKIIVGDKYEIYDFNFYSNIRFVGFDERNYQIYPDSGSNKFVIPKYDN